MRRTHVQHTRDNRRPQYYAQRDLHDTRPTLAWVTEGERQVMLLDGARVASVRSDQSRTIDRWDVDHLETFFPSIAEIHEGKHALLLRTFDDVDSARQFCESCFAS